MALDARTTCSRHLAPAAALLVVASSCGDSLTVASRRDPRRTFAPFDRALAATSQPLIPTQLVHALAEVDDPEARRRLGALLAHPDLNVRAAAAERIAAEPTDVFHEQIIAAMRSSYPAVRRAAFDGWAGRSAPEAFEAARAALRACGIGWVGAASCVTLAPLGLLVAGDAPGAAADLNAAREAWCPPREGVSSAANCVVIDVMRLMAGASVETATLTAAWASLPNDRDRVAALDVSRSRTNAAVCSFAQTASRDASLYVQAAACAVLARCPPSAENIGALRALASPGRERISRFIAGRSLPPGDAVGTRALIDSLTALSYDDVARAALVLARRSHPEGWAALERLIADDARSAGGGAVTLLGSYPYVEALSQLSGPRADAMLRALRAIPGHEGLVAALVLARRGDRDFPEYYRDALAGDRGLYAHMIAVAIARVPERSTAAPP